MAAIAYITSLTSDLDLDIAFADGCDVRFRADAFGTDNGAQCPACGRDGGMHWIGSLVMGVWDRFGCDRCGKHYSVESHVAELLPSCTSGTCRKPATRDAAQPRIVDDWNAMDQHSFMLRATERPCCSASCADHEGEQIVREMWHDEELRQTERSLMGRL